MHTCNARKRTLKVWLVVTAGTCCAISSEFVGLPRTDFGVAHAAGLLSGQSHPAAAVTSGLAGGANAGTAATGAIGAATGAVGTAATGAIGATTGAVGAATGAIGTAATGAVGATTGAVGGATGSLGAAATGALGATTNSVGAATNTIGAAATGTLNATSGAVAGAGTAATGTAVDPTIRADDTGSLAALQASGFVKAGSDPVRLVARSVNSMGEPCREYVQTVTINNAPVHATAVVCKRAWGTWHLVAPILRNQPVLERAAQQ